MEVRYARDDLRRLAEDPRFDGRYAAGVVTAYRKRIQFILDAPDERDFYALKSLRYEKLKGQRAHQRSMRLNDQMRLVLQLVEEQSSKHVLIVDIEDYH